VGALLALQLASCGGDSVGADAGIDASGADGGGAECASCDPSSEYCYVDQSGLEPSAECKPLPSACTAAPSCPCVQGQIVSACFQRSCSEAQGLVTLVCEPG